MIWEFEFEDGRRVIVHPLTFGRGRASLLNPACPMLLDDNW